MDALNLYVRNVKTHFADLNDCAICYGVLATDGTLPTKRCPNGHWFHAICLFKVSCPRNFLMMKWFKSSHGSTCPTCTPPQVSD